MFEFHAIFVYYMRFTITCQTKSIRLNVGNANHQGAEKRTTNPCSHEGNERFGKNSLKHVKLVICLNFAIKLRDKFFKSTKQTYKLRFFSNHPQDDLLAEDGDGVPSSSIEIKLRVPRTSDGWVYVCDADGGTLAKFPIYRIIFFARGNATSSEAACFAFTCAVVGADKVWILGLILMGKDSPRFSL